MLTLYPFLSSTLAILKAAKEWIPSIYTQVLSGIDKLNAAVHRDTAGRDHPIPPPFKKTVARQKGVSRLLDPHALMPPLYDITVLRLLAFYL
jgi:hypothetical protein